jgi:hypothetical protein
MKLERVNTKTQECERLQGELSASQVCVSVRRVGGGAPADFLQEQACSRSADLVRPHVIVRPHVSPWNA